MLVSYILWLPPLPHHHNPHLQHHMLHADIVNHSGDHHTFSQVFWLLWLLCLCLFLLQCVNCVVYCLCVVMCVSVCLLCVVYFCIFCIFLYFWCLFWCLLCIFVLCTLYDFVIVLFRLYVVCSSVLYCVLCVECVVWHITQSSLTPECQVWIVTRVSYYLISPGEPNITWHSSYHPLPLISPWKWHSMVNTRVSYSLREWRYFPQEIFKTHRKYWPKP